jgi:predicted PurR-regulated permease PerM
MTRLRNEFLPPLWFLTILLAWLTLWLMSELREIIVLLVVGFAIAYVMEPAVACFERRHIPRWAGVLLVAGGVLIGILLLLATAIPTVIGEYRHLSLNLPQYLEFAQARVMPLVKSLESMLPIKANVLETEQFPQMLIDYVNPGLLQRIAEALFSTLMQGYSVSLTILNITLLPFIVFYLSIDLPFMRERLMALFPILYRSRYSAILSEMNQYVSAFVRGQFLVCSILFVLYSIGLKVLGVQLWLLISVIAGFGNMVPYLGTAIGIFLASLMGLVSSGSAMGMFEVWGLFVFVQFLEGTFITPRVMGQNVDMSPLTVILAIFAGGKLFGLLGIFLAIPGAAVVKVMMRHLHRRVVHNA